MEAGSGGWPCYLLVKVGGKRLFIVRGQTEYGGTLTELANVIK